MILLCMDDTFVHHGRNDVPANMCFPAFVPVVCVICIFFVDRGYHKIRFHFSGRELDRFASLFPDENPE